MYQLPGQYVEVWNGAIVREILMTVNYFVRCDYHTAESVLCSTDMPKPRGREHTSLTETAQEVVEVLERLNGIKMIAPGVIDARRSGPRYVTAVETAAGMELIVSGQGVQKIAIHLTVNRDFQTLFEELRNHKRLSHFTFKQRERFPGE